MRIGYVGQNEDHNERYAEIQTDNNELEVEVIDSYLEANDIEYSCGGDKEGEVDYMIPVNDGEYYYEFKEHHYKKIKEIYKKRRG